MLSLWWIFSIGYFLRNLWHVLPEWKNMIQKILFFYISLSFLMLHKNSTLDGNMHVISTLLQFWDFRLKMLDITFFCPVKFLYPYLAWIFNESHLETLTLFFFNGWVPWLSIGCLGIGQSPKLKDLINKFESAFTIRKVSKVNHVESYKMNSFGEIAKKQLFLKNICYLLSLMVFILLPHWVFFPVFSKIAV